MVGTSRPHKTHGRRERQLFTFQAITDCNRHQDRALRACVVGPIVLALSQKRRIQRMLAGVSL